MEKRGIFPRPEIANGLWRHYKGGIYDVFALSRDERTGIWFVIYRNPLTGDCFHRPACEWETTMDTITGQRRFTKADKA